MKNIILRAAAAALTAIFLFSYQPLLCAALQTKEEMPEIIGIKEWKSADGPLKKKRVLGATVLIHFSSFTDLRSLYKGDTLINWQSKYYAYGLRVIHMLTPNFEFEKEITIPQHFSKKTQINYPIALDYKKIQWEAYRNPDKPFDFLIDTRGRIRYRISSFESFENEEKMIQTLIKETDPSFEMELEKYPLSKIPKVQDFPLGYRKDFRLGNSEKPRSEIRQHFKLPERELNSDLIYLSGYWKLYDEYAETAQGGAEIRFNWDGSPLFILGGIDQEAPTPIEVKIDGNPQISDKLKGSDLVKQGDGYYIFLQKIKIYSIIRRLPEGQHSLILRFPEAGAKIYKLAVPRKK